MIYITSDTHREQDIHKINPDEFTVGNSLTLEDTLIICGDFGCIYDGGSGDCFWLNWLESLPWTTVFIDGNHENFDVLHTYPVKEWHGGKVHEIRPNVLHLMRGEVFTIEGKKFFTFGGGFSHDTMYRTEGFNWWKSELPTLEEAKHGLDVLEQHDWKVDYVLTHDIYRSHPLSQKYETDMNQYSMEYCDIHDFLETIEQKLEYKTWFHGHYHMDQVMIAQNQKPCVTLFDQVILLDDIYDIIASPLEHGFQWHENNI